MKASWKSPFGLDLSPNSLREREWQTWEKEIKGERDLWGRGEEKEGVSKRVCVEGREMRGREREWDLRERWEKEKKRKEKDKYQKIVKRKERKYVCPHTSGVKL